MICGYFFTNYNKVWNDEVFQALRVFSFVVVDPVHGAMIFDTGSPADTEALISKIEKQFGLSPEDFTYVFNTHLHPDHFGNNRLFSKAKIIFSKKDYDFQLSIAEAARSDENFLHYLHNNFNGYRKSFNEKIADSYRYYLRKYFNEETIGPEENRFYIEDNPELPPFISLSHTPGHVPWHYSYTIDAGETDIYIAGDSISTRLALQSQTSYEILEKEPHIDFELYNTTLAQYQGKKGIIACGHDRPFYSEDFKTIKSKVIEF